MAYIDFQEVSHSGMDLLFHGPLNIEMQDQVYLIFKNLMNMCLIKVGHYEFSVPLAASLIHLIFKVYV